MRYEKLGKTGLEVSVITLGCMSFGEPGGRGRPWTLDEASCRDIVRQALDAGINFFDTANAYSAGRSEEITGQALKDFVPRDEVVLATKVFMPMRSGPNGAGLSRKAIFAELDASLGRLQTDYVDLYQIHRGDYGPPHEETLDEAACRDIVRQALDAGINFFDTANVYSAGRSEEITGQALKDFIPRDEVVLATKVFMPMRPGPNGAGLSRKEIFAELDASLGRLQTDYVDLYQIHRWDYDTPIEETLEALHDVVKSGKVRYIGASSMHAWQFTKALYLADLHGWTRFVSMQNHYNLLYREEEREMLPLCADQGVGVIPWSPLARGKLTRRWDEATTRKETDDFGRTLYRDEDRAIVERVLEVAAKRELSPAQVALAWVMRNPAVTSPIVGVTKPSHLSDAIAAVDVELDADEVAYLEEPYVPHAVAGIR